MNRVQYMRKALIMVHLDSAHSQIADCLEYL